MMRSGEKELMDFPENLDQVEFVSALKEFEKINFWSLNHWLIKKHFLKLLGEVRECSVLDFGCGVGDVSRSVANQLNLKGVKAQVVGVDVNPVVQDLAIRASHGIRGLSFQCLPIGVFPKEIFTVAVLSQVLHHMDEDQAVDSLKNIYSRVERGIIVSDFVRSRAGFWLSKLVLSILTGNRIHLHDGPMSILRSYTKSEVIEIIQRAGIKKYKVRTYWPRMVVVIWK